MAKYKVIAYSANVGKKVYRAHSILDESQIDPDKLNDLLNGKFIALYDEEEELKKQSEEEELKKEIEAEEKSKQNKFKK